jgi:hypothetical protein
MVLRRATSITRGIGMGGPWKSRLFLDFQGPPLSMPLAMDVAGLKTITYHAI